MTKSITYQGKNLCCQEPAGQFGRVPSMGTSPPLDPGTQQPLGTGGTVPHPSAAAPAHQVRLPVCQIRAAIFLWQF